MITIGDLSLENANNQAILMNNYKIVNCANPTSDHDVATKIYVDSAQSSTLSFAEGYTDG